MTRQPRPAPRVHTSHASASTAAPPKRHRAASDEVSHSPPAKRQRQRQTLTTHDSATLTVRPPSHPFKTNYNDHFETSLAALRDVLPVVEELRQLMRPSTPELFTLYDPYYCAGSVVQSWAALGVPHVLHENRDFYADVQNATLPGPYDMLVTNPPFSDDHIPRLLNYLVRTERHPWAFLAPDYIARKPWYRDLIRRHFTAAPFAGKGRLHSASRPGTGHRRPTSSMTPALPPFLLLPDEPTATGDDNGRAVTTLEDVAADVGSNTDTHAKPQLRSATAAETGGEKAGQIVGVEPFYILPRERYDFTHPAGTGHAQSHFHSMWYVWTGARTEEVLRGVRVALAAAATATQRPAPAVVHGLATLLSDHL